MIAALFALALSIRLLVPGGYMPVQTPHGLVAKMCGGANSGVTMYIDVPSADDTDRSADHQPQDTPCAFTALAAPALSGDAGAAIAAPALLPHELVLPPPARQAIVRAVVAVPPLRGPPALG